MKKLYYILVAFTFLLFSKNVYADTIEKLSMDIYVDEKGNANITETWDVEASGGSEWYRAYDDLNGQEISDYTVSMDGNPLTYKEWNIDESLEQKKGYYGINYTSSGLELCFGKYDMNRHTFVLNYKMSNFVTNTEDSQVIYQTLWPNVSTNSFYVRLRSFYEFPDTLDVWGFGYRGYAYVKDGVIEMSNEEDHYVSDEYVVLLAKFPANTFETTAKFPTVDSFDEVLEMAKKGSKQWHSKFADIIAAIFSFLCSFAVPFIIIIAAIFGSKDTFGTKKIKFPNNTRKLKDVPYFRELPCNKDIFKIYWIACQYGLVKNKTDFLGAILLKWLKDGNVENVTVTTKFLKKEERAIKLVHNDRLTPKEIELYQMMFKASKDGVLESNEFTSWCKRNYDKILKWFNNVIDETTMTYVHEGFITTEKKTFSTVYNVTEMLKNEATQVAGVKKFLDEFSNISDRESIDVKLWEEYLMMAQIFGIAKKVAKEFKKLYPDVITEDTYNDVIFIHNISYSGVQAASRARSAAQSYSSGGGGFSSSGGGGGSFGGGSMGGR